MKVLIKLKDIMEVFVLSVEEATPLYEHNFYSGYFFNRLFNVGLFEGKKKYRIEARVQFTEIIEIKRKEVSNVLTGQS